MKYFQTSSFKDAILWLITLALIFIMTCLPGISNSQNKVQALVKETKISYFAPNGEIVRYEENHDVGIFRLNIKNRSGTLTIKSEKWFVVYVKNVDHVYLYCVKESKYSKADPVKMKFHDNKNGHGGLWIYYENKIIHHALKFM